MTTPTHSTWATLRSNAVIIIAVAFIITAGLGLIVDAYAAYVRWDLSNKEASHWVEYDDIRFVDVTPGGGLLFESTFMVKRPTTLRHNRILRCANPRDGQITVLFDTQATISFFEVTGPTVLSWVWNEAYPQAAGIPCALESGITTVDPATGITHFERITSQPFEPIPDDDP